MQVIPFFSVNLKNQEISGLLNTKSIDEKMSKSLNNTILIRDMLQTYTSSQFRLFCLMHDYRSRKFTNEFSY
jgi:cysteinyl-tRNA synthetase